MRLLRELRVLLTLVPFSTFSVRSAWSSCLRIAAHPHWRGCPWVVVKVVVVVGHLLVGEELVPGDAGALPGVAAAAPLLGPDGNHQRDKSARVLTSKTSKQWKRRTKQRLSC